MAVGVRKKDYESSASLLRRFVRRVQQSGVLVNARKGRFHIKPKTRREKQTRALRREELRKLRQELLKLGQIGEREMIPKEKIRKLLDK